MMTRYMGITAQNQAYLFSFALGLNLIGMMITDMWLPMVAGAIVMTGLTAEAWIRVQYIIPMRKELLKIRKQLDASIIK